MAAIQKMFYQALIQDKRYISIFGGLRNTVIITICALLLGVIIGMLLAIIKVSRSQMDKRHAPVAYYIVAVLNAFADLYLTIIRGTPVVVQLIIINGAVLASVQNKLLVASVAFGINSGAYVAEIFRAGIMSIEKGQIEAGRSLGLTYGATMKSIVLPQAVKNILPTLLNEMIALLKETSVSGYVAVTELTMAGNMILSRTYNMSSMYVVAIIYLVIVMAMTAVLKHVERRMARSDNR